MSQQLAQKLSRLMMATALAAAAPALMAQEPASKAAASKPLASDTVKTKQDNPCGPSNPCGPAKKKKKKTAEAPCAPANPCAPKK